jgi:hypothetical protein
VELLDREPLRGQVGDEFRRVGRDLFEPDLPVRGPVERRDEAVDARPAEDSLVLEHGERTKSVCRERVGLPRGERPLARHEPGAVLEVPECVLRSLRASLGLISSYLRGT